MSVQSLLLTAALFASCYACLMSAVFATVSAATIGRHPNTTWMTAGAVGAGAIFYSLSVYAFGKN